MKKLITSVLLLGTIAAGATAAFASESGVTPNEAPIVCAGQGGVCLYPESCPNGGVPVRDGSGFKGGSETGKGFGNGRGCGNRENCPNGGIPARNGSGCRGGRNI